MTALNQCTLWRRSGPENKICSLANAEGIAFLKRSTRQGELQNLRGSFCCFAKQPCTLCAGALAIFKGLSQYQPIIAHMFTALHHLILLHRPANQLSHVIL